MSLRHPRQPDLAHPPHLNGTSANTSPATRNASAVNTSTTTTTSSSHSAVQKLTAANEQTWLLIGSVAEQMGDLEHAMSAYEKVLTHNPQSLAGLSKVAGIARVRENYPKAVDYFQRVLTLQDENGEIWSALGHCYLMQDDLQKAYAAYQQALYLLPNPKEDPKLWYGIGILYDRYGSLDHAEEAFSSVLRMNQDLDFDKANEILFRLGIIYKQQGKFAESLTCLNRILRNPPNPLAHADIWFQIGHVHEQQKEYGKAKEAYERVVRDNPTHAKVLQQLGWLYHQEGSSFQNQDLAISYLTKSLEADPSDAQSWYLLGRAYMAGQKYNKAYEAYQQAVYRDGRNPTFWCSIGVLYFQINQFRDALDAYSRAIRINPYISEVWFDLGSLYESCNNQISDAIDAYARASELDPSNTTISNRLSLLRQAQSTGATLPGPPGPQDVHPTAYASTVNPPPGLGNGSLLLGSGGRGPARSEPHAAPAEISLAPAASSGRSSPGPFRGGPPPPVVIDESRSHPSSHTPLGPMELDRPRDFHPGRENGHRSGQSSLLLHHPTPHSHPAHEETRNGQDSYFPHHRAPSAASNSPQLQSSRTARSPPPNFPPYPGGRHAVGPGQPSSAYQRSPRVNAAHEPGRSSDWERRGGYPQPPPETREWDRERERERGRPRHSGEYSATSPIGPGPPGPQSAYPRSPAVSSQQRIQSPRETSPAAYRASSRGSFYSKPSSPPIRPSDLPSTSRRFDPRSGFDSRGPSDYEHGGAYSRADEDRERERQRAQYARSPEGMRPPPSRHATSLSMGPGPLRRGSESPHPSMVGTPVDSRDNKRRRAARDEGSSPGSFLPPSDQPPPKRERKKRATKKGKDEMSRGGTPPVRGTAHPGPVPSSATPVPSNYKILSGYPPPPSSTKTSPEPTGSGSSSSRSVQPSPTSAMGVRPPARVVDDDYDEPSVADALMGLAGVRPQPREVTSPTISPSSNRHGNIAPSPRSRPDSRTPPNGAGIKRPLSPAEESDSKRSRMEDGGAQRRLSNGSTGSGKRSPPIQPSTRPSPIPFRTQGSSSGPVSHSPEVRQAPPSPPNNIPSVLPPHPRPVGVGANGVALPPIATLSNRGSPASSSGGAPSPPPGKGPGSDDRMQIDPPGSAGMKRGSPGSSPYSRNGTPAVVKTQSASASPIGGVH